MTKVFSPLAIDYSAGMTINENGEVIPNKIGCYVDDLKTARDYARKWKA